MMSTCKRHRFHPSIISYAVWIYCRFNLIFRDIENLLAEKGISVSYEAIRLWCVKFRPAHARKLKQKHGEFGDMFYFDEVFIKINVKQHCYGELSVKTVKWSMFIFRVAAMVRRLGSHSSAYYVAMAASRER